MEQITKATMLGHLLPVLLTTLMHPNLQTLTLADALMPQLVQLVLYTSQVRLSPVQKDFPGEEDSAIITYLLLLCFPDCPVAEDSVSPLH